MARECPLAHFVRSRMAFGSFTFMVRVESRHLRCILARYVFTGSPQIGQLGFSILEYFSRAAGEAVSKGSSSGFHLSIWRAVPSRQSRHLLSHPIGGVRRMARDRSERQVWAA